MRNNVRRRRGANPLIHVDFRCRPLALRELKSGTLKLDGGIVRFGSRPALNRNDLYQSTMDILFLTSGSRVPSTRFRIMQYLPALKAAGHRCVVADSVPPKYHGWPLLGNRLSEVPRAAFRFFDWLQAAKRKPDVIVIERELSSSGFWLPERMFRRIAPAMVLDVDDGLFIAHPQKFDGLSSICDLVIAGNRLLADRILPFNPCVWIIPTCLDTSRYAIKSPADASQGRRPVLGWTGTAHNLESLRVISKALRTLSQTHDFELLIIAEREPSIERLGLDGIRVRFLPWRAETEIEDLHRFDIGLMPLEDTEWTRYKCGLKVLQSMAIGIPAVASPVGVNSEIIEDGVNGFLASSDDEWVSSLRRLLDDANLSRRIASAGRQTVERNYSIAANSPKFEAALRDAVTAAREKHK